MVIKLKCQCGQRLIALEEAAGKMVKCPLCDKPVQVPLSTVAALLDEEGIERPKNCPDCLPPGSVVCVDCGYNKLLGRKMETRRG